MQIDLTFWKQTILIHPLHSERLNVAAKDIYSLFGQIAL